MATVAELVQRIRTLRGRMFRRAELISYWKARCHAAEDRQALSIVLPGAHMWDPSVERWRSLVHYWLGVQGGDRYGQDPGRILDLTLGIMQAESSGMPDAVCHKEWLGVEPPGYDGTPITRASGLFQHVPAYWTSRSRGAGFEGASIFNPNANIAVACYLLYASWPDDVVPHWHHWSGAHVSLEGSYEWALSQLSGQ